MARDIEMELHDSLDNALRKAKELRKSHDNMLEALRRCLPLMEEEWGGYGPREPAAVALRRAREALSAAEEL